MPAASLSADVERQDVFAIHDAASLAEAAAQVEAERRARAVGTTRVQHLGAGMAAKVGNDSLTGPSRMVPVIEPGEETSLFGESFLIQRLATPDPLTHTACFLMTRR